MAGSVVIALALGGVGLTASSAQAGSGDGTALLWGAIDGASGEVPASLAGKDAIAISSMDGHNLVLTSDGQVTGWGNNTSGQIDVPASLADVTDVGAGCGHSIALTSDGQVVGWGDNGAGQTDVPESLADKTVTAISAGCGFNLALTSDGQITAWGDNAHGQTDVPASLAGKTVTDIDAGLVHALAVTSDGAITAWGESTPVPASLADKTVTAVAAGWFHSVALTADGQVTAWGDNSRNQTAFPWWSLGSDHVIDIEASVWHSLALTADGQVLAWGHNGQCQLCVPALPAETGYTAISVGHLHSVAIRAPLPIDFTTGPTATLTGTPQVGQTLTAEEGESDPAPDSHTYRWFADDTVIAGATDPTFVVTAAEQGAAITVEVSAVKHGYATSTDTSAATEPVVAGTFTPDGTPTITGTTTVGQTLTADTSTVTMVPEATMVHQWLRDGTPIADTDGSAYVLTNADAGSSISFRVTGTKDGFTDAPVTSDAVGPVSGGVITLPAPTVTGDPVVDGTLNAALPAGELDPPDADVTWQWHIGETLVGTGSTHTPGPDDVGEVLRVRATATKDFFKGVSQSTDTTPVAQATFGTAPVATISGTVKVGHVLVAGAGSVTPRPDELAHQWYADDAVIADATDPTYTLTSAEKGRTVTVAVTASRAGYQDSTDLSAPTSQVATQVGPDVQLDTSDLTLRRGESSVLTWTSTDADTVTASGAWTGDRALSGSLSVSPTEIGPVTYVLEAANDNGSTTSQVTIEVTRAAKALAVTIPNRLHLTGGGIKVRSRDLEPGEPYTIRIGGRPIATGTASTTGLLARRVTVPHRNKDGVARVTVTGATADRTGGAVARVVTNKALGLKVAKKAVQQRRRQRVTVAGLASGEKVTVRFRGERVSPRSARAGAGGRYRMSFGVGMRRGTHALTVRGQFAGRTATTTFWVLQRH